MGSGSTLADFLEFAEGSFFVLSSYRTLIPKGGSRPLWCFIQEEKGNGCDVRTCMSVFGLACFLVEVWFFSAVWQCFRGGVMRIRSTVAHFFSFLSCSSPSIILTCRPFLPLTCRSFAPVITADFWSIYCVSDTLKCLTHISLNLHNNPMR